METNNAPLVSVIIPAYNQGDLLARAIDSALAQTYRHREIIVVNDGSTNARTKEVCERYGDKITYVERPNGGVAAARNTGLENAKGDLIALLDQDDLWLPEKLEKQVAVLAVHPHIAMVHSSYFLIDQNGDRTGTVRLKAGPWNPLPSLLLNVPISSCTTLFPRQLAVEAGFFDSSLNGSDDWDMWLRFAAMGYKFYCIGEPLSSYRVHASMTSHDDLMMLRTGLAVLDKFYAGQQVPGAALRYKDRAYFNKYAWAATIYYSLGRWEEAKAYLEKAARLDAEGVVTSRFLQSLIQAGAQAAQRAPSRQDVQRAAAFILQQGNLTGAMRHKLLGRARLVAAVHSQIGTAGKVKQVTRTFVKHPHLILDRELWAAARRVILRPS